MARRLDNVEKALWGRVIETVKPLHIVKPNLETKAATPPLKSLVKSQKLSPHAANVTKVATPEKRSERKLPAPHHNLDGHWDRRIHRGAIVPDISIDLHDANLSRAYARLDGALEQAIAQKLKVVLLVTGKPRTHDRASGEGRGAIAAVVRDWLAASRHAHHISAVRNAHPRHGGAGALYIVLKG
ncbi:MAG: DNA mismatch repair protein MutS [Sphingopyxis sp.]|nr:DNA mismatch repair protein MutS [Sphingopyxis sp.]